jgi:primase-polymerase (primpol)-like protein
MTALDTLADERRWVAWRHERRGNKQTKVPYSPHGGRAKSDDPTTWGTRSEAEARAAKIIDGQGGGIGTQLGDLGGDLHLGGLDLDACIADDGALAPWAAEIIAGVPTYAEQSPSGRGASPQLRMVKPASNVLALHNRRKASSPRRRPNLSVIRDLNGMSRTVVRTDR